MNGETGRVETGGRMSNLLAKNWKLLALRGLAGVIFGVLAFMWPGITLLALVYLFGAYALVNGVLALMTAYRAPKGYPRFGILIFQGVFSVVAGVGAFLVPGITAISLLILIASWAIVTGVIEVVAAIRLRKEIRREWLLVLAGLATIGLGVVLLVQPAVGALAMVLYIGSFSIAFGILLMVLAFRMRNSARTLGETRPPEAGTATA